MVNRLEELRALNQEARPLDMSEPGAPIGREFMPEFRLKLKAIQLMLGKVKANNELVVELKDQHTKATSSDKEKLISSKLNKAIADNNGYSKQVRDLLAEMQTAITSE